MADSDLPPRGFCEQFGAAGTPTLSTASIASARKAAVIG